MEINEINANKMLLMSEEKRFYVIGVALSSSELGISSEDMSERMKRGKVWFEGKTGEFKRLICNDKYISSLHEKIDKSDETKLCIAIADLIAIKSGAILGLVVASQIINLGLHRFCHDLWK